MNIEQAIKLNLIKQAKNNGLNSDFVTGKIEIKNYLVRGEVSTVYAVKITDTKNRSLEVELWGVKEGDYGFSSSIGGIYSES